MKLERQHQMTIIQILIPLILGVMIVVLTIAKKSKPKIATVKVSNNSIDKEVRINGQSNWN
jgi:hypothetical protein